MCDFVACIQLIISEAKVSTVIPIFSNYCTQALEENDKTLSAIAQHYGKLCEALRRMTVTPVYFLTFDLTYTFFLGCVYLLFFRSTCTQICIDNMVF